MIEAMRDLEKVSAAGVAAESHREMATLCSQLSSWMDSCKDSLLDYQDFNSSSKIWTGNEILAVFETMGVGQSRFDFLHSHMQKVMEEWMANKEEDGRGGDGITEVPTVSAGTMDVLEGFFLVLNYLLIYGMRHRDDYRVALTKSQTRGRSENQGTSSAPASKPGLFGTWLGKGKGNKGANAYTPPKFQQTLTLNFWCLNPAVSFIELKDALHSVVLTSGTLSPMASFSTELDVRFQNQLEANHVIDRRQVWIGTLSRGPNGHSLNATFRSAGTFQFQDEVGNLVAEVSETMPHGILLFLPSYSMMNKLCERWESTGLWERLRKKKVS